MIPISELEEQLVQLPPSDKLHLIEVLAKSLNGFWHADSELATEDLDLVDFFQRSPLAEAIADGEDLDLNRDSSLPADRVVL